MAPSTQTLEATRTMTGDSVHLRLEGQTQTLCGVRSLGRLPESPVGRTSFQQASCRSCIKAARSRKLDVQESASKSEWQPYCDGPADAAKLSQPRLSAAFTEAGVALAAEHGFKVEAW